MTEIGITTLLLIIANIFCSIQGLNDYPSFKRFNFDVDQIINKKDYKRLITSGFFHVSWLHLFVSIASLFFFSRGLELQLGGFKYGLIYLGSMVGGNLFALFIHRNNADYRAAGATGAVTGIIFATIALFPGFQIGILGKLLPIPGWFYGFLYVLFSIYGIKSKRDNIGHETHLASGIAGIIIALLISPSSFINNYIAILSVTIPAMFFIFIIINRPGFILIDNQFFYRQKRKYKIEQILHSEPVDHQHEIDLILEKIHQHGMESLTRTERDKLNFYSKIIQ